LQRVAWRIVTLEPQAGESQCAPNGTSFSVATPEALSLAEPIGVPLTENVTDPVAYPVELLALRLTVAVKVQSAGEVTGFGDAVTVVVVAALSKTTVFDPDEPE